MEQHLGRFLKKGEVMHHINGDKQDDRLENLQVLSVSEHAVVHRRLINPRGRIGAPSGKVSCVHCGQLSRHNVKRGLCNACYLRAKRARHKTSLWPEWANQFPTISEVRS